MAVDFSRAAQVRTRLNAIADAAALTALTPAMLEQSPAAAQSAAVNMFQAQSSQLDSLDPGATLVDVAVTTPPNNPLMRKVAVTYSAQLKTLFPDLLHASFLGLAGSASAQASTPPNIDFYLLLDNSPSMALPASADGVARMQALTRQQAGGDGCAFACHQSKTNNGDTRGNPCANGTRPMLEGQAYCAPSQGRQIDNFELATLNKIPLRFDELNTGVIQLLALANQTANSGRFATPPAYRFAAYQIDSLWNVGDRNDMLMRLTTDFSRGWIDAAPKFGVMEMYANSVGCANPACDAGVAFNDVATNFDSALKDMNDTIPTPGAGTPQPGDRPQAVLFFVTDGVEDEANPMRLIQTINAGTSHNYCSDLKARGVKIAILDTEYLPVPANEFYRNHVAPISSEISPALQACASPNMFYYAAIGSDLGAALKALFQIATETASLTQ